MISIAHICCYTTSFGNRIYNFHNTIIKSYQVRCNKTFGIPEKLPIQQTRNGAPLSLDPLDSPTDTSATLYYDLDADGSLDAENKPLIAYLLTVKKMNADGSTSPDDTWFSLAGTGTTLILKLRQPPGAANTTNNLYTGLYLVKYDDLLIMGVTALRLVPDTSFRMWNTLPFQVRCSALGQRFS